MINNQNCFAVNFGFRDEIPIPQIRLNIKKQPDLSQYGLDISFYKCFFVFVGGNDLQELEEVMKVVDEISIKAEAVRPSALFLEGNLDTATLKNLSPKFNNLAAVSNRVKAELLNDKDFLNFSFERYLWIQCPKQII